MLDRFVYVTHNGIRFDGQNYGVYLNYNDLRDYAWSYEAINDRISRFYRTITTKKIPLVVACASDDEGIFVKNRLMELAETDIAATVPGKVYIGDYYLNGYITSSKKTKYLIEKRLCNIELVLTTDNPAWYRDRTYPFLPESQNDGMAQSGTDYPYEYEYEYAMTMNGRTITCDTLSSNAFRLLIYGPATNPTVFVGDHAYTVNGIVGNGETLLVDGLNKTITLTTADGKAVNWFDKRGRASYVFEPIPPGMNPVSWLGDFGFDLTIIEKRSEPKWT